MGYAPDFVEAVMKPLLKTIKQKGEDLAKHQAYIILDYHSECLPQCIQYCMYYITQVIYV